MVMLGVRGFIGVTGRVWAWYQDRTGRGSELRGIVVVLRVGMGERSIC